MPNPLMQGEYQVITMAWLFWNVRRINKRYKQKELKQYLKDNHIKLVALLETRVKQNKALHIAGRVTPSWERLSNYKDARNGRIWVICDPKMYDIQLIPEAAQFMHCQVTRKQNGVKCLLTVIYGFNTVQQRKALWDGLQRLAPKRNEPWLLCVDFNAILHPRDRQGSPITLAELQDFSNCYNSLLLNEIPWRGDYHTWINKQ